MHKRTHMHKYTHNLIMLWLFYKRQIERNILSIYQCKNQILLFNSFTLNAENTTKGKRRGLKNDTKLCVIYVIFFFARKKFFLRHLFSLKRLKQRKLLSGKWMWDSNMLNFMDSFHGFTYKLFWSEGYLR